MKPLLNSIVTAIASGVASAVAPVVTANPHVSGGQIITAGCVGVVIGLWNLWRTSPNDKQRLEHLNNDAT